MQLDAQENSTQQDAFEYKVQLEEQPQKVTLQTEGKFNCYLFNSVLQYSTQIIFQYLFQKSK